MSVRICVCVRESTTDAAVQAMRDAARWADLVEVRADFIRDLDLPRLLESKPCPVLFTLRSPQEGGAYQGAEWSRLETLLEAVRAGADLVDVEFSAFWKGVCDTVPRQNVVLSYHNFEDTPPDLESLADRMSETGAGILKIATRAQRLSDNTRIFRLLEHAAQKGIHLCALAMGMAGVPSRILGPSRGSWMTYASLPGREATADGQLPVDEMIDLYRIRALTSDTKLYGVGGNPIGHSHSPRLHNAAFAARSKDAVYLPLEAADVEDLFEFAREYRLEGLSATIPFKEEIRARVDSISVEVNQVGAVNTLLRTNRGWHGENTDVEGFLSPLRRRTHPTKLRSVVLGAGGAARSVVYGLRSYGAPVCVVARNGERARNLANAFGAEWAEWEQLERMHWDLLVNTTPVGMHPRSDETPVRHEWLRGGWVYDLVYNPPETRLLKEAAQRGCRPIPGTEMFLCQAAKQQQLWCGAPVPLAEMSQALQAALGLSEHRSPEDRDGPTK